MGAATLTVGVNLLWCRPGRVGGAEEYLVRQLLGLAQVEPGIRVRLLVPPGFAGAHPDLQERYEMRTGPLLASSRPGRILAEAAWLPTQLRGLSVIHHGNATVPARSPGPIVLTVHDLQWLVYPKYFSATRLAYLRRVVPRSIRAAKVIAVPSEFVMGTLVDAFGVPPDRIVVVPHGFNAPTALIGEAQKLATRQRYGLGDRPVLVFPAATFPHKRHDFLLGLLEGPLRSTRHVLVLIGGEGRAEKRLSRLIASHPRAARVLRFGRVAPIDRDRLIALAEAVVFPSEYEGFGAPALESMALGTPIICSDRGALPEVVGSAGLVLPLEVDAWAEAIASLPQQRASLVERGRVRAARFSLNNSGSQLARAYRRAADVNG